MQAGNATKAQGVVGTVKNVEGVTIGLRMMSVVKVHPAEMVVMSLLDIVQTEMGDYDTPEQKALALSKSGLRAGISLR